MKRRVQAIIAARGYCSRRKAEKLIEEGRVVINDEIISLGDSCDESDRIYINGKELKASEKAYYILNKPKGYVVTKSDPQNRQTIYDLASVQRIGQEVFPVGRLDALSEGLLILTNDGIFANTIAHPRYETQKTYEIRVEPEISLEDQKRINKGVTIEGKKLEATIKPLRSQKEKRTYHIKIHEGRNRIIRKLMRELGYNIFKLQRIQINTITLGDLKQGEVREVTTKEKKTLQGEKQ